MFQSDLDIDSLSALRAQGLIGNRILYHQVVDSTMDEARKAAEAGAPEGTVILAEEQRAGRGRFNRTWVSPRGQNLLFSILLYPSPSQLNQMNMAASLAVARGIEEVSGLQPTIKWPNDVRLGGRKAAGILIESSVEGEKLSAIVGIGVNVNFDPSQTSEIASIATSMSAEAGRSFPRGQVLEAILAEMESLYLKVRSGETIVDEWSVKVETLGKQVQVRWGDQVYEGVAQSLDGEGNLLLRLGDGSLLKVTAGEVTLQV